MRSSSVFEHKDGQSIVIFGAMLNYPVHAMQNLVEGEIPFEEGRQAEGIEPMARIRAGSS
jgi:hypothetical protein